MTRHRLLAGLTFAAVAAIGLTACDAQPEPAADTELDQPAEAPGLAEDTAGQQPEEIYEARLQGVDDSAITGTAMVTLQDDELQVAIAVTGLEPNTRVPQHIHLNASCDNAGGILLNLDDGLSLPGQGEPRGDAYPQTDDQGNLRFDASRSLQDVRTALGGDDDGQDTAAQQQTAGTRSDTMNLGERVVNLHAPDMQPIACGALERTGQARMPGQTGNGQPGQMPTRQ